MEPQAVAAVSHALCVDEVAIMKSLEGRKNSSLRTATMPYFSGGSGFRHLNDRGMDVVTWFTIVAVVVVYVVMAVALYRWSVDAPIFEHDSGAAVEQALPWPQ
jgi:hypothetical protein